MTLGIEQYPFALAVAAFLFLLLVLFAFFSYLQASDRRKAVISRIRAGGMDGADDYYDGSKVVANSRTARGLLGLLSKIGSKKIDKVPGSYSPTRVRFLQAGLRNPIVPSVFWGTKLTLSLLLPAVFFITRFLLRDFFDTFLEINMTIAAYTALALVGFYLPDLWLKDRISRRKLRLQHALPDALDFLVVCVEAGLGMNAAIDRVSKEITHSHKDLGEELKIVNLEIRAGKARRDALRNLAVRTDLNDIRQLVTVLIQTERFGTSLAQALRVFSDASRQRRSEIAEERAHKLPVKLTFPMMLFIFPSIFVVAGAPAITALIRALAQATANF